jgi:hypothetical protein
VGYLDLGEIAPATLVEYIVRKLGDGADGDGDGTDPHDDHRTQLT